VYLEESSPLIKYYSDRNKLHRLSADGDKDIVLNEIIDLVEKSNDTDKV
jgi:adenylate kinase family enzyme